MKNILIVTFDDIQLIPAMEKVLLEEGHIVTVIKDQSNDLNLNYMQSFDIVMSLRQRFNKEIIKVALDAGIPVIVGTSYDASTAKICGMFSVNENINSSYNLCYTLNPNGLAPLGEFSPYTSPNYLAFHQKKSIAADGNIICQYDSIDNRVTVATFEKSTANTLGGTFAARCAYIGCSHGYGYSAQGKRLIKSILNYVSGEINVMKGITKLEDNTLVSREVFVHDRKTGEIMFRTQSDSNGIFSGYINKGDYYAIAFDEEEGTKNAVVIDRIKI